MKKLLLLSILTLTLSCSKDCEEERASIMRDYSNALQNAGTIEAVNEIKRQRDNALAELDC